MNSPLKASKSKSKDKLADVQDDLSRIVRERNRLKAKVQSKGIGQPKEREAAAAPLTTTAVGKSVESLPGTPAPPLNDLFSPISTEPSTPRADSRDTPPPPDPGSDTGTGSFGRGSRRPRGSVNYAQPNLRDKMRRPTAELVDAVAAEERARQARTAIAESEKSNPVIIKQEDLNDGLAVWKINDPNDWKQREEPTSPLSNKSSVSSIDLPSSVITERRRRTNAPSQDKGEDKLINPSSGAAGAIAALTAASSRPKTDKPRLGKASDEVAHEAAERASIYDFTDSSPHNGEDAEDIGGNNEGARPSRSSRRHSSSVPTSSEHSKGSLSISRRVERRREPALVARQEERVEKGAGQSIARMKSVIELGADGGEAAMGRNERAANRRRSMML